MKKSLIILLLFLSFCNIAEAKTIKINAGFSSGSFYVKNQYVKIQSPKIIKNKYVAKNIKISF